ncbi:MAG: 16S rRNA (guanine(527)-N(7))-methyltransferase RsmG [Anaerolineales bacterium]|nr:16S rRNA (guanine(527)-N(7))-methyltransferase RsmG [Anaerolineales bacterium]
MLQRLLGLRLTPAQLDALTLYERELLDWNTRFNLTAIRKTEDVHIKHFLDSLTCLQAMRESPGERLIDVGTGAGFPGIPLKIILPRLQLTLVESVGKKADFCRHMVGMLELQGVEIVQERAEVIGQLPAYRERYDWAVARAVAILPVLAEYLLPLVRVGGNMLAMKGESGPAEAHTAERALRILGGHLRQLLPVTLPGVSEERYLIIIDKIAATPAAYPRRIGMPAKKPL